MVIAPFDASTFRKLKLIRMAKQSRHQMLIVRVVLLSHFCKQSLLAECIVAHHVAPCIAFARIHNIQRIGCTWGSPR